MDLSATSNISWATRVVELTQVGQARRTATAMADQMGFSKARASDLAIIITELTRNLVLHAGGGKLVLTSFDTDTHRGMDVLALDVGPGIADLNRAMRDGYSTAGTAGNGLGALQRLADTIDIHTRPGEGTAVLCRCLAQPADRASRGTPRAAAICVAKPGHTHCGDHWGFKAAADGWYLTVADGLGHGPDAETAARGFTRMFHETNLAPADMLKTAHLHLRQTRGAAVAIAHVKSQQANLDFWSVGNVAGTLITRDASANMVGQHGTVGLALPACRAMPYKIAQQAMLVLTSDGVTSRWRVGAELLNHDPALVAGIIYRDHARGTDDTTVAVMPVNPS